MYSNLHIFFNLKQKIDLKLSGFRRIEEWNIFGRKTRFLTQLTIVFSIFGEIYIIHKISFEKGS